MKMIIMDMFLIKTHVLYGLDVKILNLFRLPEA